MEALINAMASQLGLDEVETPKTTARVNVSRVPVAQMAVKRTKGSSSKLMDDVVFENVGATRADGRMRLPAKMFGTRDTITVDGHKFTKLASDQNRSANFSPSLLGAEVGDTVTLVHEGGSKWTAEVTSGSRKRKASASNATKSQKAKPVAKPAGRAVKVGTNKLALVKEAAKKFGAIACQNAADGFENENILEFTKYEDDPRQYLTSRENAQAKRVWKKAGLTLSQWVEMLSEEVFG